MTAVERDGRHELVVVGAGFGGMALVRRLAHRADRRIHLVDARNHHIFQPLLYQSATSLLPPSQIAWPIRKLMEARADVTTIMAEVSGVDRTARRVELRGGRTLAYDTLVLATGATHSYFGNPAWEVFAPSLKTLEDATTIRRRILLAFERAEAAGDADETRALLTFVVIGGGSTGVELSGTIAELAHKILPGEFRNIDPGLARVLLVEAGDGILAGFAPQLSAYAMKALRELGVEVRVKDKVTGIDARGLETAAGRIEARTVLWAAGVQASAAGRWLDVDTEKSGRVRVAEDLSIPGDGNIFVIGDTAAVPWKDGKLVPGIAPAAKQQGDYVARVIDGRATGRAAPPPFRYLDQGSLATIGRNKAVIDIGGIKLTGRLAWWLWGVAHIYFLITPRSRLAVIWSWLWVYLRNEPSAQIITSSTFQGEN